MSRGQRKRGRVPAVASSVRRPSSTPAGPRLAWAGPMPGTRASSITMEPSQSMGTTGQ